MFDRAIEELVVLAKQGPISIPDLDSNRGIKESLCGMKGYHLLLVENTI
jgi:hypothetical protein